MKFLTIAAIAVGYVSLAAAAPPPAHHSTSVVQGCPAAPAVARSYLAAQVSAGRKLTMSRAAAVAEITKITGADGEFAGPATQAIRMQSAFISTKSSRQARTTACSPNDGLYRPE
jgi:hypothetical protein